jgi:hypothetical protein
MIGTVHEVAPGAGRANAATGIVVGAAVVGAAVVGGLVDVVDVVVVVGAAVVVDSIVVLVTGTVTPVVGVVLVETDESSFRPASQTPSPTTSRSAARPAMALSAQRDLSAVVVDPLAPELDSSFIDTILSRRSPGRQGNSTRWGPGAGSPFRFGRRAAYHDDLRANVVPTPIKPTPD